MKTVKHCKLLLMLWLGLIAALAACGREDESGRQPGINGYVYVPETLLSSENDPEAFGTSMFHSFRTTDGYLYYAHNGIRRVPLNGKPDFSAAELVRAASYMTGFTLDQERNLYCCTSPKYSDSYSTGVPSCITLSKYSPEGALCFQLPLPDERDFALQSGMNSPIAVDGQGNVLLLVEDGILKINKDGVLTGKYTFDDSQQDSNITKYLLQSADGQVYYIADNINNASRTAYHVTGDAVPRLDLLSSLSNDYLKTRLYNGLNGILMCNSDGTVSLFSSQTAETSPATEKIFRFEDSDLVSADLHDLIQLSEDSFLVYMTSAGEQNQSVQELLLLTKTSPDELPEKELLVLASLFPTEDLRRTVVEFNRSNRQYHITLESYGATDPWEDNEAAYTRLDGSLVSGNPPDVLDLANLDTGKYAESGALADLTPWLEQSGTLRQDRYLANLLDGYTINGSLVSIPGSFYLFVLYGKDEKTAALESWTMEDVKALTDANPNVRLLPGVWNDSSFMLEDFCADWYLEKFTDPEKGSCSFDSEEFCSLLEWIKEQLAFGRDSEDNILGSTYLYDFRDYWTETAKLGSTPRMLGFPTADGKGTCKVLVNDALALTSNSNHPEGAWAFLEYYLSRSQGDVMYNSNFFSCSEQLNSLAEEMVSPSYNKDYEGNYVTDQEGNYIQTEKWIGYINGEAVPCYTMEQSQVDAVMDLIKSLNFTPRSSLESAIVQIVREEAEYYFNNSKTAPETARVIQNRVQNLLQEKK